MVALSSNLRVNDNPIGEAYETFNYISIFSILVIVYGLEDV